MIIWLLLAIAWATPRIDLVAPAGDPVIGQRVSLWAVVSDDGAPVDAAAPTLQFDAGELLSSPVRIEPGVWQVTWRAPALPRVVGVRLSLPETADTGPGARVELPVRPAPSPTLTTAPRVVGQAAGPPVELRISGAELPSPDALVVFAPEGRVESVTQDGDALLVRWSPGTDPFPRAVPLGFRDGGAPDAPPAWAIVSLRGRPRLPVQTSPGARVSLRVGGRSYGPFLAGADGLAQASLEVRPGETTAEVTVVDAAGNQQKSALVLAGARPPTVALMPLGSPVAGRPLPPLSLLALDGEGELWQGEAPTCRSSLGDATLWPTEAGRWLVELAEPGAQPLLDLTVECSLGQEARTTTRLPLLPGPPAELVLRVWPEELTAELPVAEVAAHLVNQLGDRVASDALVLQAERGELVPVVAVAGLGARAEYRGEAAIGFTDTLRATWARPPGEGGAVELDLSARPAGAELTVSGRALDRQGRPLAGVPMVLTLDGVAYSATTDARGWGQVRLASPSTPGPWVIEVRVGPRVRRAVLFAGCALGRDPAAPDLEATILLPVRAGRVAEVFVSTDPRTVEAGRGVTARVKVELQDRGGHPVTDEPVVLSASIGQISGPELRSDGSFEAVWSAPDATTYGEVRITASRGAGTSDAATADFAASTTLELQPRRTRGAVGVAGGYLLGTSGLASPWVELDLDVRIPRVSLPLFARLSLGTYGVTMREQDAVVGEPIDLSVRLAPVSLGALLRGERGRLAGHTGAGMVMAPYHFTASFADERVIQDFGLPSPGLEIMAGTGARMRTGEITLEARYLLLSLEANGVGWQGSMGGLVGTVGYRLLY